MLGIPHQEGRAAAVRAGERTLARMPAWERLTSPPLYSTGSAATANNRIGIIALSPPVSWRIKEASPPCFLRCPDVPEELSFVDLVRLVRAGDEHASAELVRRYAPAIRIAVHARLRDPRLRRVLDSLDVCQSVLGNFFV